VELAQQKYVANGQRNYDDARPPASPSSALSTEISQGLLEQNADALGGSLLRAPVDFLVGQSAERVLDDHRGKIVHPERVALHLRFVQEFGCDDDRRRPAGGFESDAVMRTARRARPSVADCCQHDVVIGCDGLDQRRISLFGEAFLAVIV
jgi:hypothetical protein